jgi:DNA-nicking Smr family endonuclease
MPGRGNRLTQADREAWAGFARHIAPLPGRTPQSVLARMPGNAEAAAPGPATPPSPRPAPRRAEAPARPGSGASTLLIGGPPAGVDEATWQRFRTGKLAAARKLDLHGMTAQRAFHALSGFLRAAHAERLRCVEIVTGRGRPSGSLDGSTGGSTGGSTRASARGSTGGEADGEGTGVIRREFPSWLNRPDIRPLILAAAHPHAANTGSVRLLLRRVR